MGQHLHRRFLRHECWLAFRREPFHSCRPEKNRFTLFLPVRSPVEEATLAWHRLRSQWCLHRTLYEYLDKPRAKLPDKHKWAPVAPTRRQQAALTVMQAVLQDTKPDQTFNVPSLRSSWRNKRCEIYKGKFADRLCKAIQKLLGWWRGLRSPRMLQRIKTMYSTLQGFFHKVPVATQSPETKKVQEHLPRQCLSFSSRCGVGAAGIRVRHDLAAGRLILH